MADQTRRRVLGGETVPAPEKIVSLFEHVTHYATVPTHAAFDGG